jgi:Fur family peroxide stress response transcriptional regulator
MPMSATAIEKKIDDFQHFCHENGLNVTYQRLAIYRILLASDGHINPENIYKEIKKTYPNISLGTVYKTLDVFKEHKLVRKVNDIFSVAGYDLSTEPHHYLVCRKCKKLVDVPHQMVGEIKLNKEAKNGFTIEEITVFFRGVCQNCFADK